MLLREPLLHFLIVGFALFLLFEHVNDGVPIEDERAIVVDRDALLTFIQYRTKSFEPELAAARLDGLSSAGLRRLVDDYVREEALVREARALGLLENDYIIKRRAVQKMEFIADGAVAAATEPDDTELAAYHERHRKDYAEPATVTFTHVFFDAARHGEDGAASLARAKLAELNARRVSFSESPGHGDRFLYHTNYVEREAAFVASHLGESIAEAAFSLTPDAGTWHGPYRSPFGTHLVLVIARKAERLPPLQEVVERVRFDARKARVRTLREEAIDAIVQEYDVAVRDLSGASGAAGAALAQGSAAGRDEPGRR
jgi:hypothetical protein